MANLNLSQFGEKLFVADADHTFIWDTAASISKRVSRNSWLNSGTLTSDAPVTISQTWNGTGSTVFKALVVNATTPGTTSSSSSLLLDLQVGGVTTASINKAGQFFAGSASQFLSLIQSDAYIRNVSSGRAASLWAEECRIVGGPLVFSDSPNVNISTISAGVALYKEAANTLALRNGGAAQTFNVYGTYTSGSVYERMFMRYNGTDLAFQVGAETLGATARPLQLWTGGASRLHITTAGNVGIGTTAPTATLHVNGGELDQDTKRVALFQSNDVNIQNNFSVVGITSSDTTVNTFQHRLLDLDYTTASASTGTYIRMLRGGNEKAGIALANDEFVITGEAVERLRISAAGNVGIGTTAPGAKLEVVGGSSDILILKNAAQSVLSVNSAGGAGNIAFKHSNSPQIVINQSTGNKITLAVGSNNLQSSNSSDVPIDLIIQGNGGNVGIGTTSPTSKLHVAGELGSNVVTYDSGAALRLTNTTVNSSWLLTSGIIGVANGHFSIRRDSVALPALVIAGITDNVGIGITTPTAKLHVAGTIKPEQATMVDKAAGFTLAAVDAGTVINSTSATAITINLPAADTAAGYNVMIIQSGAGAVTIAANGNTLNSFGSAFTTAGQHAACSIVRTAASTYNLSGNLV